MSIAENNTINTDANPALNQLKQVFGYHAFRAGQQEAIDAVMAGQDTLVLMPTGGGKSLCYQIPALLLPGLTVVVSPLISLMKDQVDALRATGIAAAYITGNMPGQQIQDTYKQLHDRQIKLLYLAPERLLQPDFIYRLQQLDVSLFAVDEAHCVSHWGHDFRQDYCQLGVLKQQFPHVPVMGLTATADLATRRDILVQLDLQQPFVYQGSFDRPNIRYNQLTKYQPVKQLKDYLSQQDGSGIIYCGSRRKVDELTDELRKAGVNCRGYHAGMDAMLRDQVQQDFIRDNVDVIIATVAFGMGINKPNVRFVVHFDLPRTIEAYYQETGRAGRDGQAAEALLLFDEKDAARIQKWISMNDNPERQAVELQRFAAMHAFAESQTCRRQVLLNYFAEYNAHTCGNCDICLDPPRRFDGSVEAQKILSCIYRLNQHYVSQYVIDVLRGNMLDVIVKNEHHKLSTFGIGRDQSDAYWHNLINQLIHQGLIRVDITQNAILKLTEAARTVLSGKQPITLAVPRLSLKVKSDNVLGKRYYDRELFAKLKHLRKKIAEEDQVPPYVVFSDVSLAEMAEQVPENQGEFLDINGVGHTKLERYGERFLAAIQKHLYG
ncbi:DNA helicase RecQ [Neptunicella marina]|uniref:DNA helicase RecQ n=1 Tax=Neptunicella marina TaxID=2125989 RepID=UPI0018876451|nr:DNA helicase RecQ [Neptunicella marina]